MLLYQFHSSLKSQDCQPFIIKDLEINGQNDKINVFPKTHLRSLKVAMSRDFLKHTLLTFQRLHEIELNVNFNLI